MKFAKLFDLSNGEQMLYTMGLDEEENDTMKLETDLDGMHVVVEIKGGSDSGILRTFEAVTLAGAEEAYKELHRVYGVKKTLQTEDNP